MGFPHIFARGFPLNRVDLYLAGIITTVCIIKPFLFLMVSFRPRFAQYKRLPDIIGLHWKNVSIIMPGLFFYHIIIFKKFPIQVKRIKSLEVTLFLKVSGSHYHFFPECRSIKHSFVLPYSIYKPELFLDMIIEKM